MPLRLRCCPARAIVDTRLKRLAIGRRGTRFEREQQRFVQTPRIRLRVGDRLLGEHVDVVVDRLEGDERTDRIAAVARAGQHRKRSGTLHVAALLERLEREPAQLRIANPRGAAAPVAQLGGGRRKDEQPVASGRSGEHRGHRNVVAHRCFGRTLRGGHGTVLLASVV
ncbi:MAG TPA: hypothetical protein VGL19_16045, partial [Polyangiaceae bacterium]